MPVFEHHDVKIYYDIIGEGVPLMLLHAGWGTMIDGFDRQIDALSDRFQLVIPQRRGYGRSSRVAKLSPDYHREAAGDMLAVLDHTRIDRAFLWGHSDGAVIGAWMAILAPSRVKSLVFEGGHLSARKDGERGKAFMKRIRERPDSLPEEVKTRLATGHGTDYWQRLLWMWTDAWRQLYERGGDLYQNRLDEIRCPTLVIHGGRDPHTPISEMEMLATQIPEASTLFIAQAGHCLHDDPEWGDMINSTICDFFRIG